MDGHAEGRDRGAALRLFLHAAVPAAGRAIRPRARVRGQRVASGNGAGPLARRGGRLTGRVGGTSWDALLNQPALLTDSPEAPPRGAARPPTFSPRPDGGRGTRRRAHGGCARPATPPSIIPHNVMEEMH